MTATGKLGIIAGTGALPQEIAEARRKAGAPYVVIGLKGVCGDWLTDHPHRLIGLGQAGGLFRALREEGCAEAVFAGGLLRPRLSALRFDWTALRLIPRVARLLRRGDDALLRGLAEIFAERGLRLVGAGALLPEALARPGLMAGPPPTAQDLADARRARDIVRTLGPLDVGQGAVVACGLCLAVEAIEGTDLMLERVAALPRARRAAAPPPSGALYKGPKPDQDRRLDLPVVGPRTIAAAAAAGLKGIALAPGETLILEAGACLEAAERSGLFLYGLEEN